MKSRRISVRLSDVIRFLLHGGLAALTLVSTGLAVVPVNAKSMPSASLQDLPVQLLPAEPVSASPMLELSPVPVLTQSVDLTFQELEIGTFQLSESGSRWLYLYLPGNLAPNNDASYLDLTLSHTPPEPDKLSVIGLTLNGFSLAVIALSPENAEPTTYRFYLNNAPLIPGRNRLRISLDTGAGCGIRGAMVDATVYSSSLFHLEYSLIQHTPDLALYPAPFFEQSFEHEPVYVVLPHDPSATDLSAAATIAAGLGKLSDGEIRLVSALDTQVSTDVLGNHHLIVVGKRGANRLLDQLDLPLDPDDPTLSDEQGVLQELVSPWNPLHMILVVTGGSDEGLFKASQALNREVRFPGMQGPFAIVQEVLPPESIESNQRDIDFTLADLGYEDEIVYGTTPATLGYNFYMPLGWAVTDESRLILYFGHARVASVISSSMDVYLNDVPMSSVLLDESNASKGTLELALPSWLIIPGRNRIRVSIEMNLDGEDKCLFLDSTHLWTAIYSHSRLRLPFVSQDVEPSLDLFPYPFNERPSLSGLLLILPDRPRQLDYDLMLMMAAALGAADRGVALALSVISADLVTPQNLQDKDLILIGRPSIHSLIATLNDGLPQPFEPGSDLLSPKLGSVLLVQDPSRNIGLIEELAVPWDLKRTVLVITGTSDEGVALAGATLLQRDNKLAGNVALVEESVGVQATDTRALSSTPRSEARGPDAERALLIRLAECWW
jgi:hypothetical protein